MKALTLAMLLLLGGGVFAQTAPAPAPPLFRSYGVKINVPDMDAGLAFYSGFLGFAVESRDHYPAAVTLRTDEQPYTHLTLHQAARTGQTLYLKDAHTSFTLELNDIRAFLTRATKAKVRLLDNFVRIEQVGLAVTIADPWGSTISLMDTTQKPSPPPPEPSIYNYGLYLPINGYAKARAFWCDQLGLVTLMDRYLPLDQPLFSADKAWGFMLHMREGVHPAKGDYPGYTMALMQLATPDLDAALAKLRATGAEILLPAPAQDEFGRRYTAFREPFGVPVELLEIK